MSTLLDRFEDANKHQKFVKLLVNLTRDLTANLVKLDVDEKIISRFWGLHT